MKRSKYVLFRPKVRSRHPSHDPLRSLLGLLPFRSIIRLGSLTDMSDTTSRGGNRIECNTITGIRTSSDKRLMKFAFLNQGVKTATWWVMGNRDESPQLVIGQNETASCPFEFPLVAKHRFGSRGTGNTLLNSIDDFNRWRQGKDLSMYIFEIFHNYNREYRLHVTSEGCFYTCRKLLKEDTELTKRWYRNDSNSNWVTEENEKFDKPINWNEIVNECVKAIQAVGLDIGACDVRVQSASNKKGNKRDSPEFIILETNSAPSFGERTLEEYLKVLPKVLKSKFITNG